MEGSATAAEVADRLYLARRGSIGRIALRCARLGGGGVSKGRRRACRGWLVAGSADGAGTAEGAGTSGAAISATGVGSADIAGGAERTLTGATATSSGRLSISRAPIASSAKSAPPTANQEDATCRPFARSGGTPGIQRGGRVRPELASVGEAGAAVVPGGSGCRRDASARVPPRSRRPACSGTAQVRR